MPHFKSVFSGIYFCFALTTQAFAAESVHRYWVDYKCYVAVKSTSSDYKEPENKTYPCEVWDEILKQRELKRKKENGTDAQGQLRKKEAERLNLRLKIDALLKSQNTKGAFDTLHYQFDVTKKPLPDKIVAALNRITDANNTVNQFFTLTEGIVSSGYFEPSGLFVSNLKHTFEILKKKGYGAAKIESYWQFKHVKDTCGLPQTLYLGSIEYGNKKIQFATVLSTGTGYMDEASLKSGKYVISSCPHKK